MEDFSLVLAFLLGVVIGFWVRNYMLKVRVNQLIDVLKKADEKDREYLKQHSLELRMETFEDTFIFYDKVNNNFIAQVKNKNELMSFMELHYPEKFVFLDKKDMTELEKAQ
jgi:hypothetical protein